LQNAGLPNPTVVATGLGQDNSTVPPAPRRFSIPLQLQLPRARSWTRPKASKPCVPHLQAPLQSLQYSVAVNPSQATVDAMRKVVMPQLLDDSRILAQSLAAANGVKVGAIRSISDSAGAVGGVYLVPTAVLRSGDFSPVNIYDPVTGNLPSLPSSTQYTFYVNVVFATVQ